MAVIGASPPATALQGLRCRSCGMLAPADDRYVCGRCLDAVEPAYDWSGIDPDELRDRIEAGPPTLWRYAPMLPCAPPRLDWRAGWTPLLAAPRLGGALGIDGLYLKDDTHNPTLSFKDRPVAVALARAVERGLSTVACASTGNLAGALAAAAARNGLRAFVFVPAATEAAKVAAAATYGATVVRVDGTYDAVNRLCALLADDLGWGFVNFTLRPYYAEGSKTILFEVAEQLGWRLPGHVVVPVGSGALLTRTWTAAEQLVATGLVPASRMAISAAQPAGCAPVADAIVDAGRAVRPVQRPTTVAKSLAIGSPADGDAVVRIVARSGGWAAAPDDDEIAQACELVARTEGLLVEPAGGVVVAAARTLATAGRFASAGSVVLYLTGNGHKGGAREPALGPVIEADPDAFMSAYAVG